MCSSGSDVIPADEVAEVAIYRIVADDVPARGDLEAAIEVELGSYFDILASDE